MSKMKGKSILSINDTSEMREIFKDLHIKEISFIYTLAGDHERKAAKELTITNLSYK